MIFSVQFEHSGFGGLNKGMEKISAMAHQGVRLGVMWFVKLGIHLLAPTILCDIITYCCCSWKGANDGGCMDLEQMQIYGHLRQVVS